MPAPVARTPRLDASFFFGPQGWPYLLAPFIVLAVVLNALNTSDTLVFCSSALGIIPTAALMGRATEELAARSGPGIGGLLNVTFGNAPELIIALFALGSGLHELVKATLIGSIIGNILLVLGASMLVGGWRREFQRFDPKMANVQSAMLLVAGAAFLVPAILQLAGGHGLPSVGPALFSFGSGVEAVSGVIAGVLIVIYMSGLRSSLRRNREGSDSEYQQGDTWGWSVRTAVAMLAVAGVAVGVMSEILVHSIDAASQSLG